MEFVESKKIPQEDLRIIELRAENIMKIKSLHVVPDPNGNLVLFTGKNGAGKTSALNAIAFALGGEKLISEVPIRKGAESASTFIDLGKYKVTRTWTQKGSYIKVESNDGARYTKAQALLDDLVGDLSFNPLEFARMDKKKQKEVLLGLVDLGIDLDELAKERKMVFDERTDINRLLKGKESELKQLSEPDEEYLRDEISLIALLADLKVAEDNNTKIDEAEENLAFAQESLSNKQQNLANLEQSIQDLKFDINQIEESMKNQGQKIATMQTIDTDDIRNQLEGAEEINKLIRKALYQRDKRNDLMCSIEGLKSRSSNKTGLIAELDDEKQNALSKAIFPIENLSVDEKGVLYNDLPFEQAGGAERVEVSFAIKAALNPKLKVVLIDEIGDLDSNSLDRLCEIAKEKGFDIFATKVDETGKVGIVIEDGEVVSVNESMPA